MLSCGLPLGVQSAAYSISNVLIQVSVNSFGADVTTAWGLSGRLDGIVWMVTEALGVSTHHVLGTELWRAQLRAHAQGLPYVARAVVYAHWWPVCRAAGILGPLSRLLSTMLRSRRTPDDSSFYRAVLRDFLDYRERSGSIRGAGVSLQPMLLTIFGTVVLRVIWGVCDYAVRSVA